MRTRFLVGIVLLVSVLAYAALAGQTQAQETKPSAVEVKIDNFTFSPAELRVKAGTQVTWINKDDIPHNIVSEDKSFKSKVMDTDERFTFTAATPGTYPYFCGIHPHMRGKLIVE